MSKRQNRRVRVVQAQYTSTGISEYDKNPLIMALPPRVEPKRMRQALTVTIPNTTVNDLSLSDREDQMRNIKKTRIMSKQHLDFYYDIYSMMRFGYAHRNPVLPEVIDTSYMIADPNIDLKDINLPVAETVEPTTAEAVFLTGFSGNGKSTMVEHIMNNLFPEVLEHNYEGFAEPQVVYLKVDLPHNASRPGLIERLVEKLDLLLSKSSYDDPKYRKSLRTKSGRYIDIETMMGILITVLNRHHVGLIIIDEFQNLKVASKQFRQEIINLFDELANRLYIPSIKIGTPDTILIFNNNSRHKRRLGSTFEFMPLTDEKAWNRAINALFGFQPIKHPIERDEKIENLLKELTAGVPDYLFGLWQAALIEAIRSGKERLSQALIRKAFKQRFPLLKTATRNINKGKKGQHEDLLTVQQYLDADNNTMALKHLDAFSRKVEVEGIAAENVLDDIDEAFENISFNSAQTKKLNKIKSGLKAKKEAKLGPQTLEHKS